MAKAKGKGGRPPLYEELGIKDKLPLIEAWTRDGMTEISMQKSIGVGKDTWISWKKNYPEFSDALKRGKEMVLALVENSLYKKALGYEVEEAETLFDENGTVINSKVKRKHIVPDTTSIIFALKNLDSTKWRDRREQVMEHSWDLSQMSDDEIEAELKKLESDQTG
ncbi:hypothetical protein ABEX78_32215 [Priestia megaterium]